MNYLKKISPFSFSEKIELILFSIGEKLVIRLSKGLKNSFLLARQLVLEGVDIKKNGENFRFDYCVNNSLLTFELKSNSSDSLVFRQIILDKEFEYLLEIIQSLNSPNLTMVDCGANIGLTSIFFKSKFPSLKIIALEPSNETFNRLKTNIELNNFKNIIPLNKGLWSNVTRLKSDNTFRDGLDWGFRLLEAKPGESALFETVSMHTLLYDYDISVIDFLKIDIEGGEAEVFNSTADLSWLSKVKIIAIEIHDEFNCREQIERVLKNYNFEISYIGELTIGVNKFDQFCIGSTGKPLKLFKRCNGLDYKCRRH